MKRRLGEGRVGRAPLASCTPVSGEGMAAFMPVRGGGEVVKEWKEGPL